ncbi:MAG: signal recognition particle protein [Candidatus Electryonea clarkiae]|nr:signal recognition particle protein [Candidatus Electryonea clarkiae]MDP8286526.1 signal recognition particle protein [Candidatus Electryonea clarkiae]
MFNELTDKLDGFFKKLRGRGKLTESDVKAALREVRRILLEADVNFKVARDFLKRVETRAIGEEVLKSITPSQQVIKIIHDELVELLGGNWSQLRRSKEAPSVYLMVGLQGAGKTTSVGKLGVYLKKHGMRPLLAACDLQRPAAVDQLEILGQQAGIKVIAKQGSTPLTVAREAKLEAKLTGLDTLIVDTAGRLHVDDALMAELIELKEELRPAETIFVADGMTGQDAVNSARAFNEQLGISGIILTKMDGDARGGAALSIREVTGQPIRFIGVGEKLEDLDEFHPARQANRILGLGDVVSLVEKAQEVIDIEEAEKLAIKFKKAQFDLEDFLDQLRQINKMGPLEGLLQMIPGASKALKGVEVDPSEMKHVEAIILSMTPDERRRPQIINGSRRKRIARGCGLSVQDVNRLLNQFLQMKKMMKRMGKGGKGLPFGFGPMPG